MSATRLYWSSDECLILLNIFEEKNILKLIDGKKYRKKEIYKIVENEFKSRGIIDKKELQIENKWKNLKKQYITAKKGNTISGAATNTCEYYEELDRLLGSRPSVATINKGIDAAQIVSAVSDNSGSSMLDIDGDNRENPVSNVLDDTPPPKKKSCTDTARRRQLELSSEIAEFNEDFLNKYKEAVDYEVKSFAEIEKEQTREFLAGMKEIAMESNRMFLEEMQNIKSSRTLSNIQRPCSSRAISPRPGSSYTNTNTEEKIISLEPLSNSICSWPSTTPIPHDDELMQELSEFIRK